MHPRKLEHVLAIVARALRDEFPDDFYKRCAYSAFGVIALLRDEGIEALPVGGDFMAFVMSNDGRQAIMQGFGFGQGQCSHFWVEADNRRIDLGLHFLPDDARFPATPMPALAWDMTEPLPRSIRYRELLRFPSDAEMSSDPTINARCEAFIAHCRKHKDQTSGLLKFPTWLVTGRPSMRIAANKGDAWALGAERFESVTANQNLAF